jgi:hypothetical protein
MPDMREERESQILEYLILIEVHSIEVDSVTIEAIQINELYISYYQI